MHLEEKLSNKFDFFQAAAASPTKRSVGKLVPVYMKQIAVTHFL